jgi:hypothetical protein
MQGELTVTPPESLVKFDAPLFVGLEPSDTAEKAGVRDNASKLDDMINAMLPPR